MKVFISADIEGTCGIVDWKEANITHESCMYHRIQMTEEVNAACKGAKSVGCDYVLVKDAHASAQNIITNRLDEVASILRGWTGDPLGMMSGLDTSFDAAIFIGYHSGATKDGNPLSHTKNGSAIDYIKINGELASEFVLNSYTASYYGVPVVFLSGDELLCNDTKSLNPNIVTVPVSKGIGNASISINPNLAIKKIEENVKNALLGDLDRFMVDLPDNFEVEIRFKNHYRAYKASFYPGATLKDSMSISFESNNYIDVLKLLLFTI